MGVKKSVVEIRDSESEILKTAASSREAKPTSKSGNSLEGAGDARIFSKTAGASLQPHPEPLLSVVRRG
jgi:hypothetical protein